MNWETISRKDLTMVRTVHVEMRDLDHELQQECSGWIVPFSGEKVVPIVKGETREELERMATHLKSVETIKRWVQRQQQEKKGSK